MPRSDPVGSVMPAAVGRRRRWSRELMCCAGALQGPRQLLVSPDMHNARLYIMSSQCPWGKWQAVFGRVLRGGVCAHWSAAHVTTQWPGRSSKVTGHGSTFTHTRSQQRGCTQGARLEAEFGASSAIIKGCSLPCPRACITHAPDAMDLHKLHPGPLSCNTLRRCASAPAKEGAEVAVVSTKWVTIGGGGRGVWGHALAPAAPQHDETATCIPEPLWIFICVLKLTSCIHTCHILLPASKTLSDQARARGVDEQATWRTRGRLCECAAMPCGPAAAPQLADTVCTPPPLCACSCCAALPALCA